MNAREDNPQPPSVSVVMAVRNEAERIEACLEALRDQDIAGDYEIVIAEGPSRDGTAERLSRARRSDSRIQLVPNPRGTASTGLNAAIRAARSEVLVRMDGHTIASPGYVSGCVDLLERSGATCVGGPMRVEGASRAGRAIAAMMASRFGAGGGRFRLEVGEPEWADTVYLGAWRREAFELFGLFDEELVRNQDDELATRLRAGGGRVLLDPGLRTRYFCRESLTGLAKQYFDYGLWKVRVVQKHPLFTRPRQLAPAALVAGLAGLGGLALRHRTAGVALVALLVIYAGTNLVAVLRARRRAEDDASLFTMLGAAPAMHFAYGLGFLVGLVRFAAGWWRSEASPPRLSQGEAAVDLERRRIGHVFAQRDLDSPSDIRFAGLARDWRWAAWRRCGLPDALAGIEMCELGCGRGDWLLELAARSADRIAGVDLSSDRVAAARDALPQADLRTGCASAAPWPDGSFDLVLLGTALSAITDEELRAAVAAEAWRLVRRGGSVVVHDLRAVRPGDGRLVAIGRREIEKLFPSGRRIVTTSTLLPPLARRLGRVSVAACRALERLPFLRSHIFVRVERPITE